MVIPLQFNQLGDVMSTGTSRSSQIDTEKCVAQAGNSRYDMIIMATARAREIKQRNQSSMRQEHVGAVISALLEVQEGKIGEEYFIK